MKRLAFLTTLFFLVFGFCFFAFGRETIGQKIDRIEARAQKITDVLKIEISCLEKKIEKTDALSASREDQYVFLTRYDECGVRSKIEGVPSINEKMEIVRNIIQLDFIKLAEKRKIYQYITGKIIFLNLLAQLSEKGYPLDETAVSANLDNLELQITFN